MSNVSTRKSKTNIYLLKFNIETLKKCELCLKLTVKTPEQLFTVFNATPISSVSSDDFEQVNVCWVPLYQFINAEITYCGNYGLIFKNLSKVATHKKRL